MTAGVSDPLPARSNGLDNVDGGPDAEDIAPKACRSKAAGWLTKRKRRPAAAGPALHAPLTESRKTILAGAAAWNPTRRDRGTISSFSNSW